MFSSPFLECFLCKLGINLNFQLSYQKFTFLKVHQNAMKTEDMPTKCYLGCNHLLLETDIAVDLVPGAIDNLLDICPMGYIVDLELVAHYIAWQLIHINYEA